MIVVLAQGEPRGPRKRDIVRLLGISATNAASADALSIRLGTVLAHVARPALPLSTPTPPELLHLNHPPGTRRITRSGDGRATTGRYPERTVIRGVKDPSPQDFAVAYAPTRTRLNVH